MDIGKKIVAFALGLFLSAGMCAGVAHAAGEAVSTMIAIKGMTFIERDSAERPAKVKDAVLLVDTVTTREAAKAKMLFIDDSVLTLGEKTKVVVKEYVYSKERGGTSIFNLLDGKMRVVVGKAKFEVHTPTAVAAAAVPMLAPTPALGAATASIFCQKSSETLAVQEKLASSPPGRSSLNASRLMSL